MSCRMSTREKVADCIRNMDSAMLSMPMDISRIALMARSRDTNADELARFLSHHGSLSARVLKIANSSCFGRSGDIDSLSSAIIQTGFREIVAIALCSGVFTMLSSEGKCSGVEQDRIWKHNIGAGLAANLAAKSVRAPVDGFSLLTGLIHDIGRSFSIYASPMSIRRFSDAIRQTLRPSTRWRENVWYRPWRSGISAAYAVEFSRFRLHAHPLSS